MIKSSVGRLVNSLNRSDLTLNEIFFITYWFSICLTAFLNVKKLIEKNYYNKKKNHKFEKFECIFSFKIKEK